MVKTLLHACKLVSAAVRCVWPSWRHSKVKCATSRILENGGVIVFHVNTLSLFFFPCDEAAIWFLFSSRIPLPHIPREETSVFWLLRENSAKKGFWSVLVSLQVSKNYLSAVRPFARQKLVFVWIKSVRKPVASLQNSLYLTESIYQIINVMEWTTKIISVFIRINFLRYNFAILLKWGWLRKFVINELFCSYFGSSVRRI